MKRRYQIRLPDKLWKAALQEAIDDPIANGNVSRVLRKAIQEYFAKKEASAKPPLSEC